MEEELRRKAELLTKLAVTEWGTLDFSAGLKHLQEALKLYQRLGDLANMAMTHVWLARLYMGAPIGLGSEGKALEHAEAALAILEPGPDTPDKAFLYQLMARLHLYKDEPATSFVWAQKAMGIFEKLGMFMGTSVGTARARIGEVDKGIEYQESNWQPTFQGGNPLTIVLCGDDIILTHTLVRNIPRALEWGELVLPEVKKFGEYPLLVVPRTLVLTYMLSGQISRAKEAWQMTESVASKIRWKAGELEESASPGFLYLRLGEWDKAEEILKWTLSVTENRRNFAAANACCITLGSLNMEQGNHTKAEEFLLRSLEICQKGGNVVSELWVLPVLAELYLKMGKPDKATEYVDRGFELMKPDQNWYGLPAPVYLAKGMLAMARKDWGTATESFDKAVQINRQYQLPWDEARTLYERGLMYLARRRKADREKAHEDLDEALAIFQKVGARKDVEKVLRKKEMLGA
ncbi:MAG: tetratricopeptide repeat protein [Chloroflexi bacterium]|nr:tetratricopeptide repeat protein [Chloroflexota bacterium]